MTKKPFKVQIEQQETAEKLRLEKVTLSAEIELKKRELSEIIESIQDVNKRTSLAPSEYKKVERDHFKVMEDIEENIVKGRIQERKLSESIASKQESIASMQATEVSLAEKITIDQKSLSEKRAELESVIDGLNSAKSELAKTKSEREQTIKQIDAELEGKTSELSRVNTEIDAKKKDITHQENLIAIKRKDVEVYAERMKKKYPNETFIFKT